MNHPYNNEGSFQRILSEYEKYGTLYIAFDFDNTIWNYDKRKNDYQNYEDSVHSEMISLLKRCKDAGMKLILWTCCPRKEEEIIKNDLCKEWGIEPDYLNWSPLSPGATKPHFNLLLDDRAGLESSADILYRLLDYIDLKNEEKETPDFVAGFNAGKECEQERMRDRALEWYCRDCSCNDNCAANHRCAFRVFFEEYLNGNDNLIPPKSQFGRSRYGRLKSQFLDEVCYYLDNNIKLSNSQISELRKEMKERFDIHTE